MSEILIIPNTARSERRGFRTTYEYFSRFGSILLSGFGPPSPPVCRYPYRMLREREPLGILTLSKSREMVSSSGGFD